MNRCVCVHGHFYQPPRENAWLEEIEIQDSAYPYHDWNERVAAECYAPNSASRILDAEDRIIDIVNNYARISFDAGPTLLSWMEKYSPVVYRAILDADKESRERFRGHGGAMAQAYSHLIMPLASRRDKRTQVVWGIRDFESRFARKPEGMWLPETAVDSETLDIMAELGIKFTILSPYQAAQVRIIKGGQWEDASQGKIDPKMPYLCRLPSGRGISIFFYDGPLSHDLAFGDLLRNGERFAKRLITAFSQDQAQSELVHVATDGETYGHHHRFGDMALAYCLNYLEKNQHADLTVYGDYLERFPPTLEVKIIEITSWSCAHGVERWRSDCGDSTGSHPRWNQKWRAPLRGAMDWLNGKIIPLYEKEMRQYAKDPWQAREDYIGVILDRSIGNIESFFSKNAARSLSPEEKMRALKLLEMQRHAMLIYASDGWFFDDLSNVESVQVIQYAARAMQLFRDLGGTDLEQEYVKMLEKAESNLPEYKNGAIIYDRLVRPSVVDFLRLGAHYAVSSLFEEYPKAVKIAHYAANSDVCEKAEIGKRRLAVGKVRLKSEITWEERTVSYAAIHFGDQNLMAGVREFEDEAKFRAACLEIKEAFAKGEMAALIRLIDQNFGTHSYSLWHLFKDQKRKVLNQILSATMLELEAIFRQIFESNYPVMQAMIEMQIPLPEALATPAEFVLNTDFRNLVEKEKLDLEGLQKLVDEFRAWSFKPDNPPMGLIVGQTISALMEKFSAKPDDLQLLKTIQRVFEILKPLLLDIDLLKSQNIYFSTGKELYGKIAKKAAKGDPTAKEWLERFDALGKFLRVKLADSLPA